LVNKEHLDNLHECIEKNIDFASTAISMRLHNDKVAAVLEEKFREILYYLNQAYNPELLELKRQARLYYQKWLSLKDTNACTANAVYIEYLLLKHKIDEIEMPF
jgi:hypothetical protein